MGAFALDWHLGRLKIMENSIYISVRNDKLFGTKCRLNFCTVYWFGQSLIMAHEQDYTSVAARLKLDFLADRRHALNI